LKKDVEYVIDNCGYCQKVAARDPTDGRSVPTFRDPTDLLVMKPEVHVSQLRKYRVGLTGATDLLDLRAMDTAEDVIVRYIDHDMHNPQGKGSKNSRKLLPRSEWRFEADSEFSNGTKWMLWPEGRGEQVRCARRVCSPV
jgi:hypothetical protein